MFEHVIKFTAKIEEKTSFWFVENGTPIEIAEKMCLQFLQQLGQIKMQQEAQVAADKENPVEEQLEEPSEV